MCMIKWSQIYYRLEQVHKEANTVFLYILYIYKKMCVYMYIFTNQTARTLQPVFLAKPKPFKCWCC